MNETRFTRLLLLALAVLSLAIVLAYVFNSTRPFGEKYRPITELGGPFTLHNKQGAFELSDLQGKVGVLYFGFLNCTEACPASVGVFGSAYRQLTAEERERVQLVFISVDPERDSNDDLEEFAEYYGSDLIAVTGTQEQIDKVTLDYGVFFDLVDMEGSALEYTVDHSSRFYMIDKTGILQTTMSHSTTPAELAARIRQMLNAEAVVPENS